MASKRCLYISTFGPDTAPAHNAAEAIFNTLVASVFRIDFPDVELVRFQAERIHGAINEKLLEEILTADLVIADLTELTSNGFYELGMRHAANLPTVLMAQTGHALPFDIKDFRFVIYSYRATDDEVEQRTREALIEAVRDALDGTSTPVAPGSKLPAQKKSPRETRHELASRIQEAADALQSLRINSAADVVASLQQISKDLEALGDENAPSALKDAGEKVLKDSFKDCRPACDR
jgi:nucleoside 2-deoxyribosyltransferase